jgi:hypothetical protein
MTAWLQANHALGNSDEDPFDDRLIALWQKLGRDILESSIEE